MAKKVFIILILVSVLVFVGYQTRIIKGQKIESPAIKPTLLLKAPTDKILFNKTVKHLRYNSKTGEPEDLDNIMKYLYVSEVEVPQAIHQDISEDMSLRDKSRQFFPNGNEADLITTENDDMMLIFQ